MKQKLWIFLVLAAMLLTGCAKTANDSAAVGAAAWEEYEINIEETSAAYDVESMKAASSGALYMEEQITTEVADPERKLIRTVNLNAETEDFEALMAGVTEQISSLGGYVEREDIYRGGIYDTGALCSADLVIRIPAQKLDQFVTQMESISNIISRSQSSDDVTLTYADTESRVKALEVERDRLLELLEQAETTQDLLEIESRLTEVRYQLESAASQLRLYENLVSYSTVNLSIQEVKTLTPTVEPTVWQRISRGFGNSLNDLADFFVNLFVAVVSGLPIWLPVVILILLIWFGVHRANRKRAAKRKEEE